MKKDGIIRTAVLTMIFLTGMLGIACAQTAGNLTFSSNTTAPSGTWGDKHVLAIWIENATSSTFIKTNAKYGYEDDHLTSWSSSSKGNVVDAITGATLTSYGTQSVIWDGTDISSVVVPDGSYNVFIEMGWGSNKSTQHSVLSFTFEKGPNTVNLAPTGNSNYSDVVVNWAPTVNLVNKSKSDQSPIVYPNPSNDVVYLDIKKGFTNSKVLIYNSIGELKFEEKLPDGFTGHVQLDLNGYSGGMYLVKLVSPESQYVYKILRK